MSKKTPNFDKASRALADLHTDMEASLALMREGQPHLQIGNTKITYHDPEAPFKLRQMAADALACRCYAHVRRAKDSGVDVSFDLNAFAASLVAAAKEGEEVRRQKHKDFMGAADEET